MCMRFRDSMCFLIKPTFLYDPYTAEDASVTILTICSIVPGNPLIVDIIAAGMITEMTIASEVVSSLNHFFSEASIRFSDLTKSVESVAEKLKESKLKIQILFVAKLVIVKIIKEPIALCEFNSVLINIQDIFRMTKKPFSSNKNVNVLIQKHNTGEGLIDANAWHRFVLIFNHSKTKTFMMTVIYVTKVANRF